MENVTEIRNRLLQKQQLLVKKKTASITTP